MATITTRPKSLPSPVATSSTALDTESTDVPPTRSTNTNGSQAIAAYSYAQVQNQVWHWKPNDTGLDMP